MQFLIMGNQEKNDILPLKATQKTSLWEYNASSSAPSDGLFLEHGELAGECWCKGASQAWDHVA